MKIFLNVNGKEIGEINIKNGVTGLELARERGFSPPVTLMKVNGKFVPLPEKIKEGDRVEFIVTSSSG